MTLDQTPRKKRKSQCMFNRSLKFRLKHGRAMYGISTINEESVIINNNIFAYISILFCKKCVIKFTMDPIPLPKPTIT